MAEQLTAFRVSVVPAGSSVRRTKSVLARHRQHASRMVINYPGDRITIGSAGPVEDISMRLRHLFRPSAREIRSFYMELRSSLRSNPSLADGLRNVLPSVEGTQMANAIAAAVDAADTAKGNEAIISALRPVLPVEHIERLIAAAETADLLDVVSMLASSSDKQVKIVSKIVQAVIMPTLTITAAIGAGLFMASSQLPATAAVFKASKATLPLPSRMLMQFVELLHSFPLLAVVVVASPVITLFAFPAAYARSKGLQDFVDHIPVLGGMIAKMRWSKQLRMFSILSASHQKIDRTIELVAKSTVHLRTRQFWTLLGKDRSVNASELFEAARRYQHLLGAIDTRWIDLLPLGQKTGDLSSVLYQIALDYEERVDAALETLPKILEVFAIAVSAAIVGVIVLATVLPSLTLVNVLK